MLKIEDDEKAARKLKGTESSVRPWGRRLQAGEYFTLVISNELR